MSSESRNDTVTRLTVQHGGLFQPASTKDGAQLQQRLGIVVRIEDGEPVTKHAQQDDPDRPNVDGYASRVSVLRHESTHGVIAYRRSDRDT